MRALNATVALAMAVDALGFIMPTPAPPFITPTPKPPLSNRALRAASLEEFNKEQATALADPGAYWGEVARSQVNWLGLVL